MPVDVFGELSVTAEDGEQFVVEAQGDAIAINLPSLWSGRSLVRQAYGRSKRQAAIRKVQTHLQRTELTLRVHIAGRPIACLSPRSKVTLLSRLFGLGAVELKPLALFLAAFRHS
jgi:hypothetical protein